MDDALGEEELNQLALEVDEQLSALTATTTSPARTLELRGLAAGEGSNSLPDAPAQRALLEKATAQPFETFWEKYRRHLRKDLCLPGGLLFEQWKKYRDIESKAAVRVSYAWLAAFGLPSGSVAPAAVAASVFLLNVLVKVGIDAICEGCAAEAAAKGG